jgi:hypothetical protein
MWSFSQNGPTIFFWGWLVLAVFVIALIQAFASASPAGAVAELACRASLVTCAQWQGGPSAAAAAKAQMAAYQLSAIQMLALAGFLFSVAAPVRINPTKATVRWLLSLKPLVAIGPNDRFERKFNVRVHAVVASLGLVYVVATRFVILARIESGETMRAIYGLNVFVTAECVGWTALVSSGSFLVCAMLDRPRPAQPDGFRT